MKKQRDAWVLFLSDPGMEILLVSTLPKVGNDCCPQDRIEDVSSDEEFHGRLNNGQKTLRADN